MRGESAMAAQYQVLELLGSGSFGVVYKAIERATGEIVAVKHIDLESSEDDIEDIQQEIAVLSTCASPFVTNYKTSFLQGHKLWIVMEYLGGGSCLDLLRPGPFSEYHIAIIVRELLLGLDYLHRSGKIHRDVKAANILLSATGKVKLADFGVAAQLSSLKSQRHTLVGTPYWMAPEVIQEEGHDFRADVWSLGITAMELAQGEPPHAHEKPMKALFDIPKCPAPRLEGAQYSREFRDFVACCLVKDPDRRPTARELLGHKFVKGTGKVEALQELIERRQLWEESSDRIVSPTYYQETLVSMTPKDDDDDWVFDTIKPRAVSGQHYATQKRRKISATMTAEASSIRYPADALQQLDLNAAAAAAAAAVATVSAKPPHNNHHYQASPLPPSAPSTPSTVRKVSQPTSTAAAVASTMTSTTTTLVRRRPSVQQQQQQQQQQQRQPLGPDLSFGNSASNMRQFRRVSDYSPAMSPEGTFIIRDEKRVHMSSSSASSSVAAAAAAVSSPAAKDGSPVVMTKEAKLGRRAYTAAIDAAFQETHAHTSSQVKREALARVAHAWAALDAIDPDGEYHLLRAIVTRLQGDPRLASLLPTYPAPAPAPTLTSTPTPSPTPAPAPVQAPVQAPAYAPAAASPSPSTPAKSTTAHGYSPQQPTKLVLAQANPHLKSHHRRQQSTPVARRQGGDDLTPATATNGAPVTAATMMMPPPQAIMPQNMPGQIVPGKEHIHHISAVLYGRWVDGLKARWGGLS